jgi:hypothetical protein
VNYKKKLELLIENSNSRTQKNFPIGSTKVSALMVGGMFAIAIIVIEKKSLLK